MLASTRDQFKISEDMAASSGTLQVVEAIAQVGPLRVPSPYQARFADESPHRCGRRLGDRIPRRGAPRYQPGPRVTRESAELLGQMLQPQFESIWRATNLRSPVKRR